MCGIFGGISTAGAKLNLYNIRHLGFENVTRGKHSCGLSVNSQVTYGVDDDKLFYDFANTHAKLFAQELKKPIVLGHTRQATRGAHTLENAHPFVFYKGKKPMFIGVHNGTLENHVELAKKYKVDIKGIEVDSKALFKIIYEKGKDPKILKDILESYIGAAALAFYWTDEDALYLYHGKSPSYKNGVQAEERPLFAGYNIDECFYFSSIESSLSHIGCPAKEIYDLENNTVFKVTPDKGFQTFIDGIDRSNAYKPYKAASTSTHNRNVSSSNNSQYDPFKNSNCTVGSETEYEDGLSLVDAYSEELEKSKIRATKGEFLSFEQDLGPSFNKNEHRLIFRKGQYYLSSDLIRPYTTPYNCATWITKEGFIAFELPVSEECTNKLLYPVFFNEGHWLKSEDAVKELLEAYNEAKEENGFLVHSSLWMRLSAVPSIFQSSEKDNDVLYNFKGDLFTGTFKPPFSNKSFELVDGRLVSIIRESKIRDAFFADTAATKKADSFVTAFSQSVLSTASTQQKITKIKDTIKSTLNVVESKKVNLENLDDKTPRHIISHFLKRAISEIENAEVKDTVPFDVEDKKQKEHLFSLADKYTRLALLCEKLQIENHEVLTNMINFIKESFYTTKD